MENCIFCKIITGEIPSTKVCEDEHTLAFLDINPINTGHTLVVPKQHVPEFQNVETSLFVEVIKTAQTIAKALKVTVPAERIGIAIVGYDVPHTHVHVIPLLDHHDITSKKLLDDTRGKPTRPELATVAEKVRLALESL